MFHGEGTMKISWGRPMRSKTIEKWELVAEFDGDITSASVYRNTVSGVCRVRMIDRWSSPIDFETLSAAITFARGECGVA